MMPQRSGVQLLFVSCSPKPSNPSSSKDEGRTSWQKHASRQYHQRNKTAKQQEPRMSRAARRAARAPYSSITVKVPQSEHSGTPRELTTEPPFQESKDEDFLPIGDITCNQLDPFGVIIRPDTPKYAIEILQHGIHHMWNAFDRGTGAGKIKNMILTSSMISPATFYTIVFSAAAHNAFLHSAERVPEQNKLLRIQYKGLALSHLQREISCLNDAMSITDELLLCMAVLSAHSDADTLSPPAEEQRMKGALATAQDNQYYGMLTWEYTHWSTLRTLVAARGGLETVLLPGVREMLAVADLLESLKQLQCPFYPSPVPTVAVLSRLNRFFPGFGSSNYHLPKGFHVFLGSDSLKPILKTVRYLQLIVKSYEDFEAREPYAPTLQDLYVACNTVLHEALSHDRTGNRSDSGYGSTATSPTACDDFGDTDATDNTLHGLIRYACLAYILQALLPFPRASGIQLKLATAFKDSLEHLKFLNGWVKFPELTLWAAVLGGTVAYGRSRLYFANACVTCEAACQSLDTYECAITDEIQWSNMIKICRSFLWFEGIDSPLQAELHGLRKLVLEVKRSRSSTPMSELTPRP